MSLQFILGSSQVDKSRALYQKIIAESQQYPTNDYLVIVPEQFTMQTQKQLVDMHPARTIMNIDVLSFARLAYRVFEEVGENCPPLLEETGKSFVLQRVVQEKKRELGILGKNMKKAGYIAEMKSMISEFMQYQIAPNDVERLIEKAQGKQMLCHKLKDIKTIYGGFTDYLKDRNITQEEVLEVLSGLIEQSAKVSSSTIILDGFTGFTPVQYQLLRKLLRTCPKVYLNVTLDERLEGAKHNSYHHLFSMSEEMKRSFTAMAHAENVEVEQDIWIDEAKGSRLEIGKALYHLEKNLFRYPFEKYEKEQEEIHIAEAENPSREVENVVEKIHRLVKTRGLRYREIAIMTGDLSGYGEQLVPILKRENIPYFLDQTHSILMNPFVEYLRAVMDMAVSNLSYESVFRYLRSGMSDVATEDIDMLENYVIALGIRGKSRWQESWTRTYRGMDKAKITEINSVREQLLAEVIEFVESFSEKNVTVRKRTESLYEFIVKSQVQEKLKVYEDYFAQEGEAAIVKEYAQIYGIIMNLLDKLVEVLGEEKISRADYQQILETGFAESKVGIIPPSADRIIIGDIERTRLSDIKVLFFVGVNDGIIPQTAGKGGILSENERNFLKENEEPLSPSARENMYIQRFYLYQNMTKPSQDLYLSYSKSSLSGTSNTPAYLIFMICKLFPTIKIEEIGDRPLIETIESLRQGIDVLADVVRNIAAGDDSEKALQLFQWFFNNPTYKETASRLLQAAFYQNPDDVIEESIARALYGDVLKNSATRLELFSACAFAHFLEYGLGIRARSQYEFNAMDMGNVMHETLEIFAKRLEQEQKDLENISDEYRDNIIENCVDDVMTDYGNTIIDSSARNKYMANRVKRIMRRTVWALQEQVKCGDFKPGGIEISFAMNEDLAAVKFDLSKEATMQLRGRIDRVDVCETADKVYVKIIDYKSGNKSLDLVELYHGLQLQLVVYLNAAMELEQKKHSDKEVKPAGIFYYNIKDPMVDGNGSEDDAVLRSEILKDLKMNGLVLAEPEVIEHLDKALANGNKESFAIPVKYSKDGNFARGSSVIDGEKFKILSKYVNDKIQSIGERIISGEATINPYELNKKNACTYCDYKVVCGFDERICGYEYRRLSQFEEESLWQQMDGEEPR